MTSHATTEASGRGRARWFRFLPAALVLLGPIAIFGPMVLSGRVLYWGTPLLQFTPWHDYALELVRQGVIPLWNPLLGMGAPLLANHQSALLYPANWILAFVDVAWGQGLLVFLHLGFAGIGVTVLLRRWGLSPLGQIVGGAAFASGSFLVSRAGFLSLNAVTAWLPWLVLAADQLATASASAAWSRTLGPVIGLAAILSLMGLAGHAQTMIYSMAFSAAWCLWQSHGHAGGRGLLRTAVLWLAAGILAASVAAAQLAPTAEYLSLSGRSAGLDEASALTYSFWPWRTLGLLLPGLFGNPALGDYWGYGNYWEDALYVGVFPLLMALAGAGWAGRLGKPHARLRTFLVAAAGVAFLLALGQNTVVFTYLFREFPLFDVFNAPTRWNLITTFALAALAGIGADLWRRPTGRGLYWARLGTAGAVAVVVTGVAAGVLPVDLRASFGRSFILAGLWLFSAGGLTLLWPQNAGWRWTALIAVVITADLAVANAGLNPAASADLYAGSTRLAQLGQEHRVFLFPDAERILKFDRTHRFESFDPDLDPRWIRESGLPNTPLLERIPSANNFDPLLPDRYQAWMGELQTRGPDGNEDLLASIDVGWYASQIGGEPPWVEFRPISGARRAWIVPRAIPAESAEAARERVMQDGFDPWAVVVIENGGSDLGNAGGEGVVQAPRSTDPSRVTFEVEAERGGWLVVADTWYPGWSATVDGEAVSGYPANGVARAVWVPAGMHEVVWSYRPASFRTGVALSGIGVVLLGILIGVWFAQRRSA